MALDLDNKPYTVHCGVCGGRGGHEVNDPRSSDGWEDCPYCRRYEDCHLCGREIDCRDREPDVLLLAGAPRPVCKACRSLELD